VTIRAAALLAILVSGSNARPRAAADLNGHWTFTVVATSAGHVDTTHERFTISQTNASLLAIPETLSSGVQAFEGPRGPSRAKGRIFADSIRFVLDVMRGAARSTAVYEGRIAASDRLVGSLTYVGSADSARRTWVAIRTQRAL